MLDHIKAKERLKFPIKKRIHRDILWLLVSSIGMYVLLIELTNAIGGV